MRRPPRTLWAVASAVLLAGLGAAILVEDGWPYLLVAIGFEVLLVGGQLLLFDRVVDAVAAPLEGVVVAALDRREERSAPEVVGSAQVLEVEEDGAADEVQIALRLRLRVRKPGRSVPLEVEHRQTFATSCAHRIVVGAVLPVRLNPYDPHDVEIVIPD